MSDGSASEQSEQSRIGFVFVPPRWLSSTTLRGALEVLYSQESGLPNWTFTITPISVNVNPLLYQAIHSRDVAGLQHLFREGLARPTDYIPNRPPATPLSLYEVGIEFQTIFTAC